MSKSKVDTVSEVHGEMKGETFVIGEECRIRGSSWEGWGVTIERFTEDRPPAIVHVLGVPPSGGDPQNHTTRVYNLRKLGTLAWETEAETEAEKAEEADES